MGSELVNNSFPENSSTKIEKETAPSYTEIFYKVFPYYLSIGMTYEQFWNDDCLLVKYYRKADKLRLERKNTELWLQGRYFYEALCDVSPILHAFAKKGTKVRPYISEPFPVTKEEAEKQKQGEERKRMEKMKAKMKGIMARQKKKK